MAKDVPSKSICLGFLAFHNGELYLKNSNGMSFAAVWGQHYMRINYSFLIFQLKGSLMLRTLDSQRESLTKAPNLSGVAPLLKVLHPAL